MLVSLSCSSNRQSSTCSACSENSEKFVPSPSHVAPSGNGPPGHTLTRAAPRSSPQNRRRRAATSARLPLLSLHLARQPTSKRYAPTDGRGSRRRCVAPRTAAAPHAAAATETAAKKYQAALSP